MAYSSAAELHQQLSDLEAKLDRLSTALTEEIAHLENDLTTLKQPKPDIAETELTQPQSESRTSAYTVPGQLDLLDSSPAHSEENFEPIEAGEPLLQASVILSRLLKGLSAAQLANRFSVSRTTIYSHRKKGKGHFRQWSADKDPDGVPWEYRQRKYYPLFQD